ncbi:MAG: hypothetical protein GY803_15085 [Chloroflexi bacterium]|nr:hypothetical protein [Chloroflexota bacterium]
MNRERPYRLLFTVYQITQHPRHLETVWMDKMMRGTGFTAVDVYPAWDGLPLYDAGEWVVYVARK